MTEALAVRREVRAWRSSVPIGVGLWFQIDAPS